MGNPNPAESPSPLLKADPSATLVFTAEKDGKLRVRYSSWEDAKVFRPGESIELMVRSGQVWAYRRGEPLKGPAPDPYKDWDGGGMVGLRIDANEDVGE